MLLEKIYFCTPALCKRQECKLILLDHFIQFNEQFLVKFFKETSQMSVRASKSLVVDLPVFKHALKIETDIL